MQIGNYSVNTIKDVTSSIGIGNIGLYGKPNTITELTIDNTEFKAVYVKEVIDDQSIFYIFKFVNEYKIYKDSVWKTIIKDDAGVFKYLDNTDTLVPAPTNTLNAACVAAVTLSTNQMTKVDIDTLSEEVFLSNTPEAIDVIFGPDSSENGILELATYASKTDVVPEGKDIKWRIVTLGDATVKLRGVRIKW
jgi:hypothetical protein